jgi:hypothetical protein
VQDDIRWSCTSFNPHSCCLNWWNKILQTYTRDLKPLKSLHPFPIENIARLQNEKVSQIIPEIFIYHESHLSRLLVQEKCTDCWKTIRNFSQTLCEGKKGQWKASSATCF